jgi:hypothetical protein
MTANNPLLKSPSLRKRLFVSYPDDLTPSRLAKAMAHAGHVPRVRRAADAALRDRPGPLLGLGMFFVLMLHGFILSNLPIAAVFEWNVLSIYTAFFLFVGHPTVSLFDVGSAPLALYLVVALPRPAAGREPGAARVSFSWRCATTPATGRGTHGSSGTTATGSSTP